MGLLPRRPRPVCTLEPGLMGQGKLSSHHLASTVASPNDRGGELRGRLRPSFLKLQAHPGHVRFQVRACEMLGKRIPGVFGASYLLDGNVPTADLLWTPEQRGVKIAYFANSKTPAHPHGSCSVCAKTKTELNTQIGSDWPLTYPVTYPLGNTTKFCLTRIEGHGGLGR